MLKISTDAAYNPTKREAGIGIQINSENEQVLLKIAVLEVQDNHVAEFLALITAINYVQKHFDTNQVISFLSDSKIVIQSIEKRFAKNENYKGLLDYILKVTDDFPMFFPKWIPEAQNRGADALARQALRLEGKIEKVIPFEQIDLNTFWTVNDKGYLTSLQY